MESTLSPEGCGEESRNRTGPLSALFRHKLHAAALVGALILGGTAVAAASPEAVASFTPVPAPATDPPAVSDPPAAPAVTPDPATEPPGSPAPEPAPASSPGEPVSAGASVPPPPAVDPALTRNAYTIVTGDTIAGVAARYGVDRDAMLAANGLTLYSPIHPGQVVKFSGPAIAVPAPVPAPTKAAVPAPEKAAAVPAQPAGRTIFLAGAGGQSAVDRCAGPVHFTPITESMSITEHDFCGGWARFSGIQVGETVTISGVGTYTVTGRGNVPRGGTMNNVRAVLGKTPPVFLQTCIPGTQQMLVIGLG